MARIWFSVCGDGYGHALRSSVLLDHLKDHHDLLITASQKAYPYLHERYPNVHRIEGFSFQYEQNKVNMHTTFDFFVKHFLEYQKKNMLHLHRLLHDFKPHIIISDFEPFSHWLSFGLPIINIDNINLLSRAKIHVEKEYKQDLAFAQAFIRIYFGNLPRTPRNKHYVIPSYTFPPAKRQTVLCKPLLRKEVFLRKPSIGKHLLVYQTTDTNPALLDTLRSVDASFVVYGFGKNKKEGNVQLKSFSPTRFLDDLASARGVIVNGGHNVISEALFYGKPVLAVPLQHQFEQIFNGLSLQKEGFGFLTEVVTPKDIETFLDSLSSFRTAIARKLSSWNNQSFFAEIDRLIEAHAQDLPLFSFAEHLRQKQDELMEKSKKYLSFVKKVTKQVPLS